MENLIRVEELCVMGLEADDAGPDRTEAFSSETDVDPLASQRRRRVENDGEPMIDGVRSQSPGYIGTPQPVFVTARNHNTVADQGESRNGRWIPAPAIQGKLAGRFDVQRVQNASFEVPCQGETRHAATLA